MLPLLARRLRTICLHLGRANSNQLGGGRVDLEILEELQDNVRWLIGAEVFDGPARHRAAVFVLGIKYLGGQRVARAVPLARPRHEPSAQRSLVLICSFGSDKPRSYHWHLASFGVRTRDATGNGILLLGLSLRPNLHRLFSN